MITQNDIQERIKINKEIKSEGRMEGAAIALFCGLLYLILIAAIL